jgi:hypothetical protein
VDGQQRVRTSGEDRGHPPPANGKAGVADRVDTSVKAVQPPLADQELHPAPGVPERQQLRRGHDAVLAGRQPSEGWVDLVTWEVSFCTHPSEAHRDRVTCGLRGLN